MSLTGPHPDANMMDLVEQHLSALRRGETISTPVYDRETGDTGQYISFASCKHIIVEGEISTYQRFHHLIDCSIFIDSDLKTQLTSRITRDIETHGFSYEKAVTVFLNSNLKEYLDHGIASKEWADIYCYSHEHYQLEIKAVSEHLLPALSHVTEQIHLTGIQGLIVPVTTPFTKDGAIDQQAFIAHCEWLYSNGVRRILVGGTTGEFFSLTAQERIEICTIACSFFPGVVLFQCGCDGLKLTLSLLEKSLRAGIDGVFCLPPYYYHNAPPAGLIEYFTLVAQVCTVPFYLYNFPLHTGNTITNELLQKIPHTGLKDSSGNLDLIEHTPVYFTGSEKYIIESHSRGGKGFICGTPNILPQPYIPLEQALFSNDIPAAQSIISKICLSKPSIPGISGIALIKAILSKIIPDYKPFVRPPLVRADVHPQFTDVFGALPDFSDSNLLTNT
jgi:4-hydroxy-tetrahydrodipicolinate synthase